MQYGFKNENDLNEFWVKVNPEKYDLGNRDPVKSLEQVIVFNERIGEHIKVSTDRSVTYIEPRVTYESNEIPALIKLKDSPSISFVNELKIMFDGRLTSRTKQEPLIMISFLLSK